MSREIKTIGILGTGTMGRGIAQIAALAGRSVVLHDARDGAAGEAAAFVGSVNGGNHIVPTVLLPNGAAMTNPGINEVLAAVR